ncbi:MAG: M6 family metalloprotease domain-containing protein [Bacteroidetes bacterium]|jgi:M6 family metalloprotease-like protein|nr:M6 family metalloprotease domain-containing protein [Bacteroidota bacterium]MBT5425844.1 M6 family metalloprotease domain-containing protein [Bacteroidota bacterium]MBT7095569.1 M6 family metalloprotease domain-containing protein [Bacteroidota bacterium]MBT7462441.1 M6 family metalloprotease domain-containing protein [Bacteroidota bacterium]
MKRLLSIILPILFISFLHAHADNLKNIPQTVKQPDGTIFHCLGSGDEFYHYLHDENGFTIVMNPADGYFYYGIRDGEEVIPSVHKVNSIDPQTIGLKAFARISRRLYLERKEAFLAPLRMKGMTGAPTTGYVNQLSVYISFADDSIFSRSRESFFDAYSAMGEPSLRDYFNEVSFDRLFVDTYHFPVSPDTLNVTYISTHPRAYYMPYSASNPQGYKDNERSSRERTLLRKAIEFITPQIPDTLELDANGDGRIDNVCFTIRGATTAWATLLWPHRSSLSSGTVAIRGLQVRDYLFMLENTFNVATLCHEFFHVLGAPDLYHYNDTGAPTACGPWDIMDQSGSHNYMGAFMKYKYGKWMATLPEITESGTYSIYPLQQADNNIWKISSPLHPSEYFVLENRKREGIYESTIPGEGLVVYRINPNAGRGNAGGPPDEIYVYRPGGTLTEQGSFSDAPLGPKRTAMNDGTNPSSFLYNNGNSGKGGLDIFNVVNHGDSITFDVNITALHPPVDLVFTLNDTILKLDWLNLYTEGFENYVVYKNGERFRTTTVSRLTDTDIIEGQTYTYYVTASYVGTIEGESEPSNSVNFTPKGIMSLPYAEDFESLSHGWNIAGNIDGFQWGLAAFHEMDTDNTSHFLAANSFLPGHSANTKDMAISPRLDLEDYSQVTLEFDYTLKRLNSQKFLQVWIRRSSTDGWILLRKLGVSGFGPKYVWKSVSIDLPSELYFNGAQLGFQYSENEDLSYGTGFDNLVVHGIRTGIEISEQTNEIEVFPNPSNGNFTLRMTGEPGESYTLRILTLDGRELMQKEIIPSGSSHVEALDLSDFADGIFLLVVDNKNQVTTRKLVKKTD